MANPDAPFLLTPRATGRRNSFSITNVGAPQPGLDPQAQQAAFDAQHPFAPSGTFTPTPAAAPPVDSAGGLYDTTAAGAGAGGAGGNGQAAALSRVTAPGLYSGGASPASSTTYRMQGGVPQASSMTVRSPAVGAGGAAGGADPLGGDPQLSPVLTAALGLQQMKEDATTQDTINNLARAGAIPHAGDSPEIRANKFAYLTQRVNEQGAQALGLAKDGPRAAGSPVYTGDQPGAPDPKAHAGIAEAMATVAARMQQQGAQGHYEEDPVSHERKFVLGKSIVSSGSNPQFDGDGVKQVNVGGRKLSFVGGHVFDEKGQVVSGHGDEDRPLTLNEFVFADEQNKKFGGDYGKYRDSVAAAKKAYDARTPPADPAAAAAGAAAPGTAAPVPGAASAAPAAPAKPGVWYPHTDVQAELRKRGLLK